MAPQTGPKWLRSYKKVLEESKNQENSVDKGI